MKKVDFQSEKQLKDGNKKETESHPQSLKFDSKKQPINYLGQENKAPSIKSNMKQEPQGIKAPQQKQVRSSNQTTPRSQIKQQGKSQFLTKEPTQTDNDDSDSDYSIESVENLIPQRYPQIKLLPKKRKRKDMSLFFEQNVLDQNRIRKINFVKSSSETSSDTEEDEHFPQRGQNRGPIIIAPSFDPMIEYSKHGQSIDPYKSVQFSQKSINPAAGQKSVMQTQKSIMQSQKSIAQGTVRSIAPPPSQKQYGSTSKQQAGSVKQSTVKSAKQSVAKSVKLPPPELSRYIEPQKQEEWAKYETPPVVDPYVIQKPSQAPPPNNPQKPLYRIPKPRQQPKKQDIGFQKQEYKSAGVQQPQKKIIEEESDSDSYCDCCA